MWESKSKRSEEEWRGVMMMAILGDEDSVSPFKFCK